jgi:hypothetical protein
LDVVSLHLIGCHCHVTNLPNDIMPDNRNSFNQMMNETINNWQRRSYVHQKRMDNEESDESSDESESEMDRHHFQTPDSWDMTACICVISHHI